jgi:MFS family permease
VAAAAIFSVRLYGRMNPRLMGAGCFILNAVGFALVALTISRDWGTLLVIVGLVLAGVGEGTMLTLLFNVLVSASPKEYAGDVGALRGVVNNVSSALGAAFAGVVAVTLLTGALSSSLDRSTLPPQFNLDNVSRVDFVSDAQLRAVLATTPATPAQADELMRINQAARISALRSSFLLLALICLVAIFPAMRLPRYRLVELDAEEIVDEQRQAAHRAAPVAA